MFAPGAYIWFKQGRKFTKNVFKWAVQGNNMEKPLKRTVGDEGSLSILW